MTVIEMAVGDEGSRFNTVVAIALITTLLMVLLLPMAFAAGKETSYSAYEDTSDASQLSDVRTTLGPRGAQIGEGVESQGYNIANTISTPMLVNDWKKPHLTMLLIVGPEKPIDETEAQAIYDFVTKEGGKVVVAADNSNANTLAGMFGLTYYDAPLFDSQQMYGIINEDGDEFMHPTNVWGLQSINKDDSEMQESERNTGCSDQMIEVKSLDSCRMPVMYRQPTGIKVGALETDDPESSDFIQRDINVLSYASKAAFIDIARDGKEGTLQNDAPGDIALTVRIDYPGIMTSDLLRGAAGDSDSGIGDLTVTGSIVFVADDEVFANQYWTLSRAEEAGLSDECTGATCWQNELTGGDFWQGNHAYFHALIWDMMELDNNDLANTIKNQRDNFNIVFDESRHVTGVASQPFIETISTIVLLTSDDFLKWLIILNLGLLLLVSIMVVPEKANWRHVFDLTRFRERPTKLDATQYRQRVQKALFAKVRVFYDLTRDQMALKTPAEVQQMIGDPRLVELAYSTTRTYSPQELRELLTSIRKWGKK